MGSPRDSVPSGNIHPLQHGVLHGLQCGHLLRCSLSRGCTAIAAWAPGTLPPSPSALTLWLTGLFHTLFFPFSSLLTSCTVFCPFSNIFSQGSTTLAAWLSHARGGSIGTGCVQHGAASASPHSSCPVVPHHLLGTHTPCAFLDL